MKQVQARGGKAMANEFLSDIQTIRERARRDIEEGAVTAAYKADRDTVLKLLDET
jgi:bacterioferritin